MLYACTHTYILREMVVMVTYTRDHQQKIYKTCKFPLQMVTIPPILKREHVLCAAQTGKLNEALFKIKQMKGQGLTR